MWNPFGGGGRRASDRQWEEEYERRRAEQLKYQREERVRMAEGQAAIDSIPDEAARMEANRRRYKCGPRFTTLQSIPTWRESAVSLAARASAPAPPPKPRSAAAGQWGGFPNDEVTFSPVDGMAQFPVSDALNAKVSLWQGDITTLEVDAIVNAANGSLLGGGGIDGAIHSAAGPLLLAECEGLNGAQTGETKVTKGYCLPARYVFHTVGPIGYGDEELRACYRTCLQHLDAMKLRSVAFCCVSTGIFGFPLVRATHIAGRVVREWLEEKGDSVDRVVFCVFRDVERLAYETILPAYFPVEGFPKERLPEGVRVPGPEPPRPARSQFSVGQGPPEHGSRGPRQFGTHF